jgi:serine/threonine protein kinase
VAADRTWDVRPVRRARTLVPDDDPTVADEGHAGQGGAGAGGAGEGGAADAPDPGDPGEASWAAAPGAERGASAADPGDPGDAPWAPGVRLGSFELVRRLGEGATGEVWEAVDRRYDAPVALKLFAPQPGRGAATMDRAMAEARAASRVVSDHVVYTRDAGRIEGGPTYIAMALCREETTDAAVPQVARNLTEDVPRSLDEAVRWGEQIARGVAAAHAQHVFHRDLKPENVLCLPHSRQVRILDFGLAPLAGAETATVGRSASQTQTLLVQRGARAHIIAGTPAYMPPEQARGFTRLPDPDRDAERLAAMDIYGIGATLWALLTGRPPHAELDESVDPLVVLERAATTPAPALDSLPTRFRVPPRLARIVARAMADDPADRYPSAAALAVDLACFRALRPTSLDPAWAPVRLLLLLRRHPALAASCGWVLLTGAAAAATWRVYDEVETASAALRSVRGELADAQAAADAQRDRAEAAGERADQAADEAETQSARAETAEEHAAHLRQYAVTQAARAVEADRRAGEAASLAQQEGARAAHAEAVAVAAGEKAARAEGIATAEGDRAGRADDRATAAEAARTVAEGARATAEAARAAALARADEAERAAAEANRQAADERARAERADRAARLAEERNRAAEDRAGKAQAEIAALLARMRAAEAARADIDHPPPGDAGSAGGANPPGGAGAGAAGAGAAGAGAGAAGAGAQPGAPPGGGAGAGGGAGR